MNNNKKKYKLVYKNGRIEEDLLTNADYKLCIWKKDKLSKMPNYNRNHLKIIPDEKVSKYYKHD